MNNIKFERFIITDEQKEYLSSKDEVFSKLIDVIGEINNNYIPDPFVALVNSIVYQAISYKAATTIWNRFSDLVEIIDYEHVLAIKDKKLRECGLSNAKVSYIKNIAKAFKNKRINLEFDTMTNEEIVKRLTKIKGVGKWTAQMFLTFSLFRKDVISYDDLAIRRGIQWLYKMEEKITIKEFNELRDKFSPYNTIASLYLWEITLRKLFDFESIDSIISRETIKTSIYL